MSIRTGAQLIEDERLRQIEREGWTAEHDAQHEMGEIAAAAICYAELAVDEEIRALGSSDFDLEWWPWATGWWKPSPDPVRNLQKAGALIAAEMDRLLRLQPTFACERCNEPAPTSQMFLHVITENDGVRTEQLCLDCKESAGLLSTAESAQESQ